MKANFRECEIVTVAGSLMKGAIRLYMIWKMCIRDSSYALDCIEAELVNIKNKHGKRVAYISIRTVSYTHLDVYKRQLLYKKARKEQFHAETSKMQKSLQFPKCFRISSGR